jgi:putative transport protein
VFESSHRAKRLADVFRHLGDSYRALRELDLLTFGLGVAAGLLLGLVPDPAAGRRIVRARLRRGAR